MNKTRLLAVTVNPFSAKGSHYNKTEFYDAMCSGLGGRVPVLDVVSEFGCEARSKPVRVKSILLRFRE